MFSDARIQELAADFVCVKVDPRDPGESREAFEYKSTRYVPEVVFIAPDGEIVDGLDARDAKGAAETMESVLDALRE